MSVPGYQEFMYPVLEHLKDEKEHSLQELYMVMADYFNLSEKEINERLPSGKQTLLRNRVSWAKTYLNKAELIETVKRGVFRITYKGKAIADDPEITRIDRKFLTQFDSFNRFINNSDPTVKPAPTKVETEVKTPMELIEENYDLLKQEVQDALLDKILDCTPAFFEHLIVRLVVAMGYGGSVKDAGEAIGKSGDEGIDGIIKEDVLGLEMIYLQAKRWKKESTVSRPDIQTFVGSLVGKQASKGIFITTTKFSRHAYDYANSIDKRVILIDGEKLTDLMFKYDVGVANEEVYITKRMDLDFFEE